MMVAGMLGGEDKVQSERAIALGSRYVEHPRVLEIRASKCVEGYEIV